MLKDICKENEEKILLSWLNDFFHHHKLDDIGVSRTITDKFLNPVAFTIKASTKEIFPAIIGDDVEPDTIKFHLDEILKIQAIQQLSPAQALLPLITIKNHIYAFTNNDAKLISEFKEMTDRLDTLLLMAFDIFTQEKEKIYRIRVNELKSAQSQVLRYVQDKGLDK